MKLYWVRGKDDFDFLRAYVYMILGVRGSGKSSFLETLGIHYLTKGAVILDLFGSRDGEGLAWLRSPYAKDKKILILHGEYVDVDCSFPTKKSKDLKLKDLEDNDIIISASPCYSILKMS